MRLPVRMSALCAAAMIAAVPTAWARTYTVGPTGTYGTIQEAIDIAREGDIVVVAPGVYAERIAFRGDDITVRSIDPDDDTVVANTILDGAGEGSVVTFQGDETEACILSGFTIAGGLTDGPGGGILGNGTGATIARNVIEGNEAAHGGGLHGCAGELRDNIIRNNAARDGAGLYGCSGEITANTITGNSAERYGGGAGFCSGSFTENVISGNSARDGAGLSDCTGPVTANHIIGNLADQYGGGLARCSGSLVNNIIARNLAESTGAGLAGCSGAIYHNTVVANAAGVYAGGIALSDGAIVNTIIWGNTAPAQPQIDASSSAPLYSCIQDWPDLEGTNIADDPTFVAAEAGDYHLAGHSPCIDAGGLVDVVLEDFEGDPRGFAVAAEMRGDGSAYDIGADEHIPTAYPVTVGVAGSGEVDPPTGEHVFDVDAEIPFTAIPAPGWLFAGWEGDLVGAENPTTLLVDGPKVVTAVFEPGRYTVTTAVEGSGLIVPEAGTREYSGGSTLQLTAIADMGWAFNHWTGDLTGNANPATVLVDADKTITAVFVEIPPGGGYRKPMSPLLSCQAASPTGGAAGDVGVVAGALALLLGAAIARRFVRRGASQ